MSQTLFIHHRIYTLTGVTPIDGAILAADGKIQFVGALDDARGLASESCVEVRLPGEVVLPGFHDAHIHTGDMARGLVAPQLGGATNYQEVLRRLSEFATFRSGETWVLGGRWDSHEWHCGSAPDKADLDAILGRHLWCYKASMDTPRGQILLPLRRREFTAKAPKFRVVRSFGTIRVTPQDYCEKLHKIYLVGWQRVRLNRSFPTSSVPFRVS